MCDIMVAPSIIYYTVYTFHLTEPPSSSFSEIQIEITIWLKYVWILICVRRKRKKNITWCDTILFITANAQRTGQYHQHESVNTYTVFENKAYMETI